MPLPNGPRFTNQNTTYCFNSSLMKFTLIAVVSIFLVLSALAAFRPSPRPAASTREARQVAPFTAVLLATNATVVVRQGPQQVVIEGPANELARLTTTVAGAQLRIGTASPQGWERLNVRRRNNLTVYVTMPAIRGLAVTSSGQLEVDSIRTPALTLAVSGSGELRVRQIRARSVQTELSSSGGIGIRVLWADSLRADVTGSGSVAAAGRCTHSALTLDSSGDIDTDGLATETCSVRVGGSGSCQVNAARTLGVRISSSGTVVFVGNPKITLAVSGSGQLRRKPL